MRLKYHSQQAVIIQLVKTDMSKAITVRGLMDELKKYPQRLNVCFTDGTIITPVALGIVEIQEIKSPTGNG